MLIYLITTKTVAHFLGAEKDVTCGFSLIEIQGMINCALNSLDDLSVQKYYSLVKKILSEKMRNCIEEYITNPPPWMFYFRDRIVNRENVCAFWDGISDGRFSA